MTYLVFMPEPPLVAQVVQVAPNIAFEASQPQRSASSANPNNPETPGPAASTLDILLDSLDPGIAPSDIFDSQAIESQTIESQASTDFQTIESTPTSSQTPPEFPNLAAPPPLLEWGQPLETIDPSPFHSTFQSTLQSPGWVDRLPEQSAPETSAPWLAQDDRSNSTPARVPAPPTEVAPSLDLAPEAQAPEFSQEVNQDSPLLPPNLDPFGFVELVADHQDYDQHRNLVTAIGNVFLRFREGELKADFMQFNTNTQVLHAEGNVRFLRGRQRLEGEILDYNLVQEVGQIEPAVGEVLSSESGVDLDFQQTPSQPLSLIDLSPVTTATRVEGITISSGFGTGFGSPNTDSANPGSEIQLPVEVSTFRQQGTVKHWRFQAERADLRPDGWDAYGVRMTNDPFSPPQFEVRAPVARYRELEPLVSELRADRPRYVFEDTLPIPTFRRRVLFDRRPQDSGLFTIGFDNEDRGGLFIERSFEPVNSDRFRLTFTPQFLVQKAFSQQGGNILSPDSYALKVGLSGQLRPGTSFTGSLVATDLAAALASLSSNNDDDDQEDFNDTLRGNLRAEQYLPWQHRLNLEASFRDRLFNGSLGFQTVQRSLGAVVVSPDWQLGNTGIHLTYQAGVQAINADTDRSDLLEPVRRDNRVDLTRYQTSVRLSRGFTLWRGEPLPATPDAGLRYTPVPVQPFIGMGLTATGVYGIYSSGDVQDSLTGQVSLTGVFGHFSRPWFDYTQLNVAYSHALRGSQSPFLFDRVADTQVISFGITQQIFGPIRFGFQTSLTLDTDQQISVDYKLEYSRRAFDIALRFNPELAIGSLTIRLNDFLWQGRPVDF